MIQIFSSTFGRRRVFVDEYGIHEERRAVFTCFISWNELSALNGLEVRSTAGTRIRIDGLSPPNKCRRMISTCWKERYPAQWNQDRRRFVRGQKQALYIKLPATVLAVECAGYAFFRWVPGPSDDVRQEYLSWMMHHLWIAVTIITIAIAALTLHLRKAGEFTAP